MKTHERNAEMYSNNLQVNVAVAKESTNAANPRPQPESVYAAQALDQSLGITDALIIELTQRLKPVLENRPQKELEEGIGKAERQMFSPIGQGLMDTVHRIDVMNRRLAALIETLAV